MLPRFYETSYYKYHYLKKKVLLLILLVDTLSDAEGKMWHYRAAPKFIFINKNKNILFNFMKTIKNQLFF